MENDPLNIGDYINCYNEIPQGYYLDKNDLILESVIIHVKHAI